MIGLGIVVGLFYVPIDILAAVAFGNAVAEKGYPEKKGSVIFYCIFLPIAGYLLACALPDRRKPEPQIIVPAPTGQQMPDARPRFTNNDLPEL